MENNNVNKLIKSLVVLALLIVVLVGVTFAYFVMVNNDIGDVGGRTVDSLPIQITGQDRIQITNLIPILSEDVNAYAERVNFNVLSTNPAHPITYTISLIEINITPNLISSDFRWTLVGGDSNNVIASGTFDGITPPRMQILDNLRVDANMVTSHNYSFRVWIETDGETPQNDMMNGQFSARLAITANMVYEN